MNNILAVSTKDMRKIYTLTKKKIGEEMSIILLFENYCQESSIRWHAEQKM